MKINNVLIVDDSLLGRISMKKSLAEYNFNITEAENGYDALLKIGDNNFDLIFLDLLMPKMDGFETLQKMQDDSLNIPTVIVSADIQNSTIEKCKKLGAFGYLNKPLDQDELSSIMDRIDEK